MTGFDLILFFTRARIPRPRLALSTRPYANSPAGDVTGRVNPTDNLLSRPRLPTRYLNFGKPLLRLAALKSDFSRRIRGDFFGSLTKVASDEIGASSTAV